MAISRFSLLSNRLFRLAYIISSKIRFNDEVIKALIGLDRFADQVVKTAAKNTYQGRLLEVGISPSEATTQFTAIIFVGANSSAVLLAVTLFHLVQNADASIRLLLDIRSQDRDRAMEFQASPYLRAVIKEGLQLGWRTRRASLELCQPIPA